jgi:hypothetical protein
MKQQFRASDSKSLLKITSEPYVIYTKRGYQAAVDVSETHSGENFFLIISAISLADELEKLRIRRNGKLEGTEIIISKASKDRMSPYIVSSA